ncbi:hypothetical protein BDN70DRAFT_396111 [Pholiota conissans]|uniref:Uncharacterized protein n=1 Tax=Pholiota conissans TaxID=109636 RepID=A0A9P6CNX9_9AGAR|nr:hypothetical protein BDN70DRAFT_396111 [Pholiota conissans]
MTRSEPELLAPFLIGSSISRGAFLVMLLSFSFSFLSQPTLHTSRREILSGFPRNAAHPNGAHRGPPLKLSIVSSMFTHLHACLSQSHLGHFSFRNRVHLIRVFVLEDTSVLQCASHLQRWFLSLLERRGRHRLAFRLAT